MDREIAPGVRRKRVARNVVLAAIAIAAISFFLAATVEWLRPSLKRRDIRTARVERTSVDATLQASGTVVPLVEQVVSSPVEARVMRIGRRAGDRVKPGDEILALDTSTAQLDAERLRERVEQLRSNDSELRLRLDESIATTQAQLEQRRIDAEILHHTANQRKRLRDAGLIAESDALAAAAQARKSDIEIRQLEEALVRAKRSRAVQLEESETGLRIAQREFEQSNRQLQMAMLRADREGVLTYLVSEEGATVRRGDVIARIADLSAYRVVATISDIHASRLSEGQRAIVKLDETMRIGGTIRSIDPRIENGVVRFYVELDEPAHARLRNNLRIDVSVITGRRDGVLAVQRGVLGRRGETWAFIVRGDEAVRVPVRFGLTGDERIEIADGLVEGDEIVISDTTDYKDMARVRLK